MLERKRILGVGEFARVVFLLQPDQLTLEVAARCVCTVRSCTSPVSDGDSCRPRDMSGLEQQQMQQLRSGQAPAQAGPAPMAAPTAANASRSSACPPHVLEAIYGKKTKEDKKAAYEGSLQRWWSGDQALAAVVNPVLRYRSVPVAGLSQSPIA